MSIFETQQIDINPVDVPAFSDNENLTEGENTEGMTLNTVFSDILLAGAGQPSQKAGTYGQFIAELLTSVEKHIESFLQDIQEYGPDDEDSIWMPKTIDDLQKVVHHVGTALPQKYIYTYTTYPFSRPVVCKFTLKDNVPMTYGILLYAYTVAYQSIYELVLSARHDLPDDPSEDTIEISGHGIEDLCYNGISLVKINGSSVWCEFDVDS